MRYVHRALSQLYYRYKHIFPLGKDQYSYKLTEG